MSNKVISLDEQKQIQLSMLKEIDLFCRDHHIRYMLACGTLLGAIRHHGYIPWDDDVDIAMPFEDMLKFRESFHSETLDYLDGDMVRNFKYDFSKICHKGTFSKKGLISKGLGVQIDIYPVVECSSNHDEIKKKLKYAKRNYSDVREFFQLWNYRLLKILPIKSIPGYLWAQKRCRQYRLYEFPTPGGGEWHFIDNLPELYFQRTVPFNPFDELVDLDFEGLKLLGPARYDEYLRTLYGNYMELPPEEERLPSHGGARFYWK